MDLMNFLFMSAERNCSTVTSWEAPVVSTISSTAPTVARQRNTSEGNSWCACFSMRLPARVAWFLMPTLAIQPRCLATAAHRGTASPTLVKKVMASVMVTLPPRNIGSVDSTFSSVTLLMLMKAS